MATFAVTLYHQSLMRGGGISPKDRLGQGKEVFCKGGGRAGQMVVVGLVGSLSWEAQGEEQSFKSSTFVGLGFLLSLRVGRGKSRSICLGRTWPFEKLPCHSLGFQLPFTPCWVARSFKHVPLHS